MSNATNYVSAHDAVGELWQQCKRQQAEIERLREQLQAGPPVCQECDGMRAEIERLRLRVNQLETEAGHREADLQEQKQELERLRETLLECASMRSNFAQLDMLCRELNEELDGESITCRAGYILAKITQVLDADDDEAKRAAGGK